LIVTGNIRHFAAAAKQIVILTPAEFVSEIGVL
jgi:hypothetical protein